MKRVIILCLIMFCLIFTACKSEKEKYLEKYERVAVNIIENHSTFTSEEWQMAESSYELLRTEYTQFSLDMTPEERYHVDDLNTKINAIMIKKTAAFTVDQVKSSVNEIIGTIEELLK